MSKAWTASSTRSSTASTWSGKIAPSKFLHKQLDITSISCFFDIRDINSGLRCMWARHLATFWFMLPDTFSFTTTITLAMHMHGLTVEYVSIDYHQRIGRSSIRPIRDTVKFFSLVVRAVMYFRPLQVFGSLALLLMITSAAAAIISQLLGRHLPDVIVATMFSTGIILFALGLLGDLINVRWK